MAPTTTRWVHGTWRIMLVSVCRIRPKRVYNNARFLIGVTVLIESLSWTFNCPAPIVSIHDILSATASSLTDCPLIKPLLYVRINSTKKMKYMIFMFRGNLCKCWVRCWLISFCCLLARSDFACDFGRWLQLLHKNPNLSNQSNIHALKKSEQVICPQGVPQLRRLVSTCHCGDSGSDPCQFM
jgi:hypothetical protein